jgi:hypothetical protein
MPAIASVARDNKRRGVRALVVNCSAPRYNLGAHKLANWLASQGHSVTHCDGEPGLFTQDYNLVCLSVIFSWHTPLARDIALRVKDNAEVWCGGPGVTTLGKWWREQTGLDSVRGLDGRFERQRGDYRMTFASRGCGVGCSFCIVKLIEGRTYTVDWDFRPAPILCDNNLSALPVEFQNHIVRRYTETGVPLLDANSGFEPRSFDEDTFHRWKPVLCGPWRMGFDTLDEGKHVERAMRILRDNGVRSRLIRVYCLIGNEPIAACYERLRKIVEWGGEPYCQPCLPLNWLRDPRREPLPARYDWTDTLLHDFARYANRYLWRSVPLWEYSHRRAQGERPPFAAIVPR